MENTIDTPSGRPSELSPMSVGIKYGVYFGLLGIVMFAGFSLAGINQTEGWTKWLSYPIFLVAIFLAHKYYKDHGDGYMAFGQGVSVAFWLGAVASVMTSVFMFIYIKFIDSSFIETMRETQIRALEEKNMSQEQIDQAMDMAGKFMTPTMIMIFGIIGGIVIYVLGGCLVTIFTQKRNPNPTYL